MCVSITPNTKVLTFATCSSCSEATCDVRSAISLELATRQLTRALVHLERKGFINEEVVVFWMAELSCALQYLHRQKIIHRDIKPDNILLDAMGHAHFTDFNVTDSFPLIFGLTLDRSLYTTPSEDYTPVLLDPWHTWPHRSLVEKATPGPLIGGV